MARLHSYCDTFTAYSFSPSLRHDKLSTIPKSGQQAAFSFLYPVSGRNLCWLQPIHRYLSPLHNAKERPGGPSLNVSSTHTSFTSSLDNPIFCMLPMQVLFDFRTPMCEPGAYAPVDVHVWRAIDI